MPREASEEIPIAEAALELRLPRGRAYDLVLSGALVGRKDGPRWVVTRASIDAFKRRSAAKLQQQKKIARAASGGEA